MIVPHGPPPGYMHSRPPPMHYGQVASPHFPPPGGGGYFSRPAGSQPPMQALGPPPYGRSPFGGPPPGGPPPGGPPGFGPPPARPPPGGPPPGGPPPGGPPPGGPPPGHPAFGGPPHGPPPDAYGTAPSGNFASVSSPPQVPRNPQPQAPFDVRGPSRPGHSPADFKHEKPEIYGAFVNMAIRSTRDGGTEVWLPDGMCQDKHAPDFLKCLHCWLLHNQGDNRSTGRPWKIQCLNLSGNGLSDASVSSIMEQLQAFDLRVEYLYLRGNGIESGGLEKITQYIWNCQDPLAEVDLVSNLIEVDSSNSSCSDSVSALLRCLYNHSSYPKMILGHNGIPKVVPLILRLGRNKVQEPARLLKAIEAKVGKDRVQIRPNADAYDRAGEEFLSLCLPEFLEQLAPTPRERTRKRKRSHSRDAHRREQVVEAPIPVKVAKPEKSKKAKKLEKATKKEKKEKKSKRALITSPPKTQEVEHHKRSESEESASSRGRKRDDSDNDASQAKAPEAPALIIPDSELRALQQEVSRKLGKFHLPKEDSSLDDLSEYIVCMAQTGKGASEIQDELVPFLGDDSLKFVRWFGKYIQRYKKS